MIYSATGEELQQQLKIGLIRDDYPVGFDEAREYGLQYQQNTELVYNALDQFLKINHLDTIGDRLAFARKRRGLMCYELSLKTGISGNRIRSYERGGGKLGATRNWIRIAIRLCDAMGLSMDYLLGRSFTLNGSVRSKSSFLHLDQLERERLPMSQQLFILFTALIDGFDTIEEIDAFCQRWEAHLGESEEDIFRSIYDQALNKRKQLQSK